MDARTQAPADIPDRSDGAEALIGGLWKDLDGAAGVVEDLTIDGPAGVLTSAFDVTGFATACVGAAVSALAELVAARTGGRRPRASVDRLAASASFRFEALMAPEGWQLPPIWDPVAGDYEAADGWIRLHTNYRHHLDAVLAVLDVAADRAAVAEAVGGRDVEELESAVVAAGGCAAAMRTAEGWDAHPAGRSTASERPVVIGAPVPISGRTGPDLACAAGSAPLAGVRILDLTRVIAGPVATRYLAAYGADVLRIDPPGFDEVSALLPESPAGKRCAALDLATSSGRDRFLELVASAHVVVSGLRPDALARLDLDVERLRSVNPSVVTVAHDAYGWSGPWAGRRGFDSLVQMSTGIAAAGAAVAGTERPTPLPAQALDHGVGHLLAAATARALTRLLTDAVTADVRGSLVGAANVVRSTVGAPPGRVGAGAPTIADAPTEVVDTAWGRLRHAPLAGRIEGLVPEWRIPAGPLGRDEPRFETAS